MNIIVTGNGTSTVRDILAPALDELAVSGRECNRLLVLAGGSEESAPPSITTAGNYVRYKTDDALIDAIAGQPDHFPYVDSLDRDKLLEHSRSAGGSGSGQNPLMGRAHFEVVIEEYHQILSRYHEEWTKNGDSKTTHLHICQGHSGTSAGSLVPATMAVQDVFKDVFRILLFILPVRAAEAHRRPIHAQNTLSRLRLVEHGMQTNRFWSAYQKRYVRRQLYNKVLIFSPNYLLRGERGSPLQLNLSQLHQTVARTVTGFVEDPLYLSLMDEWNNDQDAFRQDLSRSTERNLVGKYRYGALNEARIIFDAERYRNLLEEKILRSWMSFFEG